ncbi:MAG: hypothetical protein AAB910_01590, partial [Patescibacteria group bacterium]
LEDPLTSIRWCTCRLNVPYVDLTLVRVADILITRTFLPPPPTRVSLGTMSAGGVIAIAGFPSGTTRCNEPDGAFFYISGFDPDKS